MAVIDVVDEHVQRAHALLQAGFQVPPFVGGNDPGDQVERDQAFGAGGVARYRKSNADPAKAQVGFQAAHGHGFSRLLLVPALERLVLGADAACALAHFVISGGTGCSVLHGSSNAMLAAGLWVAGLHAVNPAHARPVTNNKQPACQLLGTRLWRNILSRALKHHPLGG
ncbi:hypothetical protein D3C73_721240 [compost metagenome]